MTKERSIPFLAQMVRAILDGRKTQTRRIVKNQQWIDSNFSAPIYCHFYTPLKVRRNGEECEGKQVFGFANEEIGYPCPYGAPYDRLWVRETFGRGWCDGHGGYSALCPTGGDWNKPDKIFYRADGYDEREGTYRWRPSIFMPRAASRIMLAITYIRVERLQDIVEEDAEKEGFAIPPSTGTTTADVPSAVGHFRDLWQQINGKTFPWHTNPWVWVIAFQPLGQSQART